MSTFAIWWSYHNGSQIAETITIKGDKTLNIIKIHFDVVQEWNDGFWGGFDLFKCLLISDYISNLESVSD